MKRIFIVLLVVIAFAACKNQTDQISSSVEVPVRIKELKKETILKTISTNGTVDPYGEVELKTESEGYYRLAKNPRTGKPFMLGDKVKKGEAIIVLENEEYLNSIRIETQKLDLESAQSEYEKQQSLYEKGGVTLRELKTSEISYLNSKYDLEKAEIQLAKLKVTSPIDGVIVELPYFTSKTKVNSGVSVVKLMDYSKLILNIDMPEKYITDIYTEQKANITNYNLKEDTLTATVTQLSPAIDENTRTFRGVLIVENEELVFRPGMFVKADIVVDRRDSAIVVPIEVISKGRRGKIIYVVDERSTAVEKRIVTGIESGDNVEIVKGLEAGDKLVYDGFEMLSNRSKVKIIR